MNINENFLTIRDELKKLSADAILCPMDCSFDNVEVPYSDLYYVSGFTGSNGRAIISKNDAFISVDGRYTKQVLEQVDTKFWNIEHFPSCRMKDLIEKTMKRGEKLVVCSLSHSYRTCLEISYITDMLGIKLQYIKEHPISSLRLYNKNDDVKLIIQNKHKIKNRLDIISSDLKKGESILLGDMNTISWILGIKKTRLGINDRSPLARSLLFIMKDKKPLLFCDLEVEENEFFEAHDISNFEMVLNNFQRGPVQVCFNHVPGYFVFSLENMGFDIHSIEKNYDKYPSIKDPDEIEDQREVAINTSIIFTKTLAYVKDRVNKGENLHEDDVYNYFIEQGRLMFHDNLVGLSFNPISAFGKNTSIVHYVSYHGNNSLIKKDGIFLLDAGFHFLNGTSDLTRCMSLFDNPDPKIIENYTIILKAFISYSNCVFKNNIKACQLDTICRHELWKNGMDYPFGTGHGVGYYSIVHEYPRISQNSNDNIQENMISTVEPGYYNDEYGLRIENMLLTRKKNDDLLYFETLSYIPFDMHIIDINKLNDEQKDWLNKYNLTIREKILPYFKNDEITYNWIMENTIQI